MALIWVLLAALWGIAEASVFFVIPDVIVTCAAVRWGFRAALKLALVAAVAASLAGIGMYQWASHDPAAARAAMLAVPFIGPDLLAKAHAGMASARWPLELFAGALTGTPYKLYAVEAGALGTPLALFVALSVPARLLRFLITGALAAAGSHLFNRWGLTRWRYPVLAAVWIAIYAVYWTLRSLA